MLRSKYAALIGMFIALILFFGLDRWLDQQAQLARRTSDFRTYMIWIIVVGLVLGILLYTLSWLTLLKSQRSTAISIIFMLIGLLVYLYPVLYLWAPSWISWPHLSYLYTYSTPVAYTGIFIAVLGFLHLSLPQ
jgi:hypothetical protein